MDRKALSLLLLLAAWMLPAQADLPQADPVPGGIAIVPIAPQTDSPPPTAFFADRRVMVVPSDGHWRAVVGIPLDVEPGSYNVIARSGDRITEHPFEVAAKDYPTQRLTLRNRRHVEPSETDLARIGNEVKIIREAFGVWTDLHAPELRFDLPAGGRFSSAFGLRRFFNDQPRRPHSGLDIAAPTGTPVTAPAGGVVVAAGDYFFNGNTVFLDHGQGLISMYCHLARITVKPGESVARGGKIGEVGMTGRATGPHLHWTVSLNNSAVDPTLFLGTSKPAAAPDDRAAGDAAAP